MRIELPSNQPLVLLKEIHGERHVPIWIGTPEASAIALAQQGVVPPRPMTHDLLVDVVEALGHTIVSVNIVAVEDNIFYGQLQFDNGTTVSSRASDALALALRAKCRIWCADAVMDEAGVRITEARRGRGHAAGARRGRGRRTAALPRVPGRRRTRGFRAAAGRRCPVEELKPRYESFDTPAAKVPNVFDLGLRRPNVEGTSSHCIQQPRKSHWKCSPETRRYSG